MAYPIFKLLHVAAVVLFLGNITTGLFWVHHAARQHSPARLGDAMEGVIRSDRLFTFPAVLFIVVSGLATAHAGHLAVLRTGWIVWALGLSGLSGLLFAGLAPLQRRIRDHARSGGADWAGCRTRLRRWNWLGGASLVSAWAALAAMVLKLPH